MALEPSAFQLILDAPNYGKILFGFPSYREMGLLKYNLYKLQQRLLNPENIPRKKKTSLYKVSSRHLELWIEDSFIQNFDQHAFDALAFIWSRAKRDNLPFKAACNVHFKKHKIKPTPIKFHGTLTLTSHIKMTYHVEHYLPVVWKKHPREYTKKEKIFKDTLYSLQRWLLELILRLFHFLSNHTVATESLTHYLRTRLYRWHLYSTLRSEDLHTPFSLNEGLDYYSNIHK
ncbi:hypothetical protein RhiirC2_745518 [Rhizophagus irregularis]|uniref:Uncharacterized protein n=1 Tax=Rhizophagus irregularis TaxID=588596 RepID=A0A2N1NAK0_9GLOM|nr:hypothetical protein RhiirC2_745518 [Rhizophagus irregularis]